MNCSFLYEGGKLNIIIELADMLGKYKPFLRNSDVWFVFINGL